LSGDGEDDDGGEELLLSLLLLGRLTRGGELLSFSFSSFSLSPTLFMSL
jgi:hypothetical protein